MMLESRCSECKEKLGEQHSPTCPFNVVLASQSVKAHYMTLAPAGEANKAKAVN